MRSLNVPQAFNVLSVVAQLVATAVLALTSVATVTASQVVMHRQNVDVSVGLKIADPGLITFISEYAPEASRTCPLNVCCSQYG